MKTLKKPSFFIFSLIIIMTTIFTFGIGSKSMANIEPEPEEKRYLEYCIPAYEYTCVKNGMLGVTCLWKGSGCNY